MLTDHAAGYLITLTDHAAEYLITPTISATNGFEQQFSTICAAMNKNKIKTEVSSTAEPKASQTAGEDISISKKSAAVTDETEQTVLREERRAADRAAKQLKWERRMERKKAREAEMRREEERRNAEIRAVHESFMREALKEAQKAADLREVPIGCVIAKDGKIIARGYNRRNTDANTLSHAELNAIRDASRALGDWRLEGCTLYVTLEPCQMCAGAIVQSRIDEVVIGCMNPKAGCAGSVLNLMQVPAFNHQVKITKGILEKECSHLISSFFEELRSGKISSS
ncbi:MAG: tRNA adenosine(34) deaminase TadA [Bilifractor sp.]